MLRAAPQGAPLLAALFCGSPVFFFFASTKFLSSSFKLQNHARNAAPELHFLKGSSMTCSDR